MIFTTVFQNREFRTLSSRGGLLETLVSSVPMLPIFLLALLLPSIDEASAQKSPAASHQLHAHPAPSAAATHDDKMPIAINNNHKSGGRIEGKTFTLDLEARMGTWYPDGAKGGGLNVAAFGEVGKGLQVPGPLIRVPLGATVVITVSNKLGKPLTIFGLDSLRGTNADSMRIDADGTQHFRFVASAVGTFYYAGKTTRAPLVARHLEDSQLNGVIIVDSTATPRANDQPFLISWWYMSDSTSPTGLARGTMVINGRSWPHTEQLQVTQGDSLHWRWINLTLLNHPMHLHGFYYRVDGSGNGASFQTLANDAKRTVVTEMLAPGATMEMTWSPNRAGNWIFHCHMAAHMSHHMSIGTVMGIPAVEAGHDHNRELESTVNTNPDLFSTRSTVDEPKLSEAAGLTHSMAGLVLGIRVKPTKTKMQEHRATASTDGGERKLHLYIRSRENVFGQKPGYAYSLDEKSSDDPSAFGKPGPTLVLQQNQPVAITVVNKSTDGAAVHWHGIELESFPDGVPGWSGADKKLLPAIAPGDSLTVRFTPPRAGTFMYHSHFNELQQIASGLYGAIVVLAPGQTFDSTTDRVMMFGDDGPTDSFLFGPYPLTRLNGLLTPPLEFQAGVTYRLRFINIRTDYILTVKLNGGLNAVRWKVVAKDGRDLPASQITETNAALQFAPGEIYDIEFTPTAAGRMTLEHRMSELPPPMQAPTWLEVRVK